MKKYVALVLFAVMVLALIPTANALANSKVILESVDDSTNPDKTITIDYASGTFAKTVDDTALANSYLDAYDAVGKPYYFLYLPVPSGLKVGGYLGNGDITDGTVLKVDGTTIKEEQLIEKSGALYVKMGKVDLTKGLSKTFNFVLTNDGVTVTASAKVALTIKDTSVGAKTKKTMAVAITKASKDGVAIYTKGGTVYVDVTVGSLAYDKFLNGTSALDYVNKVNVALTYGGKNIVPDGEKAFIVTETGIDVDQTEFTNKTLLTGTIAVPDGSYPKTSKITLKADTRDVLYVAKDIPVVFRRVSIGDPKGIVFVDGEQKNVKLGDEFTLDVKGKEATLFESVTYIIDPLGSQLLLDVGDGVFQAIGVGSTYVRANYTYLGWLYSDTIKVVISDVPATTDYYVVCRALNVRKGPGTNYGKVGLVYRNDVIKVIEVKNGWAKIWYKDTERYVSFKYLAIK